MKLLSAKKITIAAFIIVALGLLTIVGVLMAVTRSPKVTVDDLAQMKTLAHKYLNERYRLYISSKPQNNPNIADAPVIEPSEMSPELAARQKEDVKKLEARGFGGLDDDFATYLQVSDIRKEGSAIALYIIEQSAIHMINYDDPPYYGEGNDRYFKFARKGNGWILLDAKLLFVGGEPSVTEPSVKSYEKGVLSNPLEITKIPEEVEKLDDEATKKILNKWAVNRQTIKTLIYGDPDSYIMGKIVQFTKATPSDKPDAICFIKVKESGSYTYPEALLAVTKETKIIDQHNDPSTFGALKEGQTVEVVFTIFSQNPWNANAREISISP